MVDSDARERIGEAKEEMNRLRNEDDLRETALLILANKKDLPNATVLLK